jgi:hypothetical protein
MSTAKVCSHLAERPDLDIEYALDSHLHVTDAFAKCARCNAHYLLELADMRGTVSVFRVSSLNAAAVAKTIASLNKGSCDINRARDEVFSLSATTQGTDILLVMRNGRFSEAVPQPLGLTLPNKSWRELACDGSVIELLGL